MRSPLFVILSKLNPGWLESAFDGARRFMASSSSVVTKASIAIACFIFVIQLIKMYRDVVSDEQQGGFGGISSKQILRPILIFILLYSYPSLVSVFDNMISTVSSGIESAIPVAAAANSFANNENVQAATSSEKLSKKQIKEKARETALANLKEQLGDDSEALEKLNKKSYAKTNGKVILYDVEGEDVTSYSVDNKRQSKKRGDELDQAFSTAYQAEYQRLKRAERQKNRLKAFLGTSRTDTGTLLGSIMQWLFKIVRFVYQAMAQMTLCLLTFFGPLAIALSMVSKWEGAGLSLLAQYVQTSLWMPIIAAITYIIETVVGVGVGTLADKIAASINGDVTLQSDETVSSIKLVSGILYLAGVFMIMKVPSIASSLLSLGGSGGADGGAAAAAGGAMGSAAGSIAKLGGKGAVAAGKGVGKTIGKVNDALNSIGSISTF